MATTTVRTCDLCDEIIPPQKVYVNAEVYGRECHQLCFDVLTAMEVVGFLGLSDIKIMRENDWDGAVKATGYKGTEFWREHVKKRLQDLNSSITLR